MIATILAGIAVLNTLINSAAIIIGARTHDRLWDRISTVWSSSAPGDLNDSTGSATK